MNASQKPIDKGLLPAAWKKVTEIGSARIAVARRYFSRKKPSSGGSYGGSSNSCGCNCGDTDEASEGHHEDNEEHHAVSNRDERVIEAPSRDVHRDANGVIVEERDRERRHLNDNAADRNRDSDKKHDKDMKKDEHKDKDKDKDNDKKEEAKK
jgi:hypothetical protein